MNQNHSNKKIKQKITEHEFPFSEQSWEKMDAILTENNISNKATTKTVFIMTTLLILLSLLFATLFSNNEKAEIQYFEIATNYSVNEETVSTDSLKNNSSNELTNSQYPDFPKSGKSRKAGSTAGSTRHPDLGKSGYWGLPNLEKETEPKINFLPHEKTYLHLDRTFYKSGEAIWFTAYLRDANSLKTSEISDILYVELFAPNGNSLKKLTLIAENGIASGDIQMDPSWVGGIYKIKAYTNYQKNFDEYFEREITVQKTVLPNLRMELDFAREAYGSGEKILAQLNLNTLSNQPLTNHDFDFVVNLAGKEFLKDNSKTDAKGKINIEFSLPKNLESNDGLLNVLINFNGQTESISRSIPIVLNQIDLQFLPEGGQMVAGIPTRIAFKALNEFGKAADLEGIISNEKGEEISTFKSYHQGMGSFDFSPKLGEKYFAKIINPKGILETFELPEVLEEGVALNVQSIDNEKVSVSVDAKLSDTFKVSDNLNNLNPMTVILRQGDTIFATKELSQIAQTLNFQTSKLPIGIAQITILNEQQNPLAERLIFINPHKKLQVEIKTDKEKYLPREEVNLEIFVKNEKGEPVQGDFSLAVCDDQLLSFADDKQGHILSNLLLESELKGEIFEPNFYFENAEKHPEKDQKLALDLLMMTQGWRRVGVFEEEKLMADLEFEKEKFSEIKVQLEGVVFDQETGFFIEDVLITLKNNCNAEIEKIQLKPKDEGYYKFELKGNCCYEVKAEKKGFSVDFQRNICPVLKNYQGKIPQNLYLHPMRIASNNFGAAENAGVQSDIAESANFERETDYARFDVVSNLWIDKATGLPSEGKYPDGSIFERGLSSNKPPKVSLKATTNNSKTEKNNQKSKAKYIWDGNEVKLNPGKFSHLIEEEGSALNIRGSKSNATKYYLDGIRIQQSNENDIIKSIEAGNVNLLLKEEFLNPKEDKTTKGGLTTLGITQFDSIQNPIRIRGQSSLIDTPKPLYILDGIPVSAEKLQKTKTNEIKEVLVLKNEEARLFYGEAGKNGVLLFFTEKEKKRSKKVDLSKVQTVQNETVIEYEKAKSNYLENQLKSFLGMQNALLSEVDLKKLENDLAKQKQQIRDLENRLNICNKLLKEEKNYRFNFKELEELKNYKKALKFKTGYYQPREFYEPKFRRRDSLSTRFDFRNTIYWNPKIQTDKNGKATVKFRTSDAITTFRATLEGIGNSGKIGRAEHYFYSQPELGLQIKLPTNLLTGDLVKIPVTISNHSENMVEGQLSQNVPKGIKFLENQDLKVVLKTKESKTIFLNYQIENQAVSGSFGLRFSTKNGLSDEILKPIFISSRGFPVEEMFAGNALEETFEVPILNPIEGSLEATFKIYPNIVGEVLEGLDRMLRQPTGCFEQTSSKNYPNILVLNYLQESGENLPEIEKRAEDLLEKGYQRLLGFEVKGGGFDWYGKGPAHEGLTAYGLMQFVDMSKVFQVESDLIERTAEWLLSGRNGEGGWLKNSRSLHSWNSQTVSDAYICWAMTEAGFGHKIQSEINQSFEEAIKSNDPYLMALMLNVLGNLKTENKEIGVLSEKIFDQQKKNGSWLGKTTITNSRGKSLEIETTALAVLALLENEKYLGNSKKSADFQIVLRKGVQFLTNAKTSRGFGSTQSTVLAMKALIEYTKFSKSFNEGGEVALIINGKKVSSKIYEAEQKGALVFENLAQYLNKENNKVKVEFSKTEKPLTYDLDIKYTTRQPKNSEKCLVNLETSFQNNQLKMGKTVRFTAVLTNTQNEAIPNTIALIGIPAGLSLQPWQLKEMQEKALFDFYEIMSDGKIAFHFLDLAANEKVEISLDLKADIPGVFEAPASEAFLYYWNEERVWAKPESLEIEF